MPAKRETEGEARTVSPGHWIRLAAAYLLIPLVLLICGGDPGWWQAWFYAVLILAAGPGGRVWAERRHPGLTAERQDIGNIRDANGNLLVDGDSVTIAKDIKLDGKAGGLKAGTKVKSIRLVSGDHEIDAKLDGRAILVKAEFVKKA